MKAFTFTNIPTAKELVDTLGPKHREQNPDICGDIYKALSSVLEMCVLYGHTAEGDVKVDITPNWIRNSEDGQHIIHVNVIDEGTPKDGKPQYNFHLMDLRRSVFACGLAVTDGRVSVHT